MTLMEIVHTLSEDATVNYLVVSDQERKMHALKVLQRRPRLRVNTYVVDVNSLDTLLGVDPWMIYIDEEVFDKATAKQLRKLYSIQEQQERMWRI